MSGHFIVFVSGLFGVPLALLAFGHHLRKRSARDRRVFWGAVVGHCTAAVLALMAGMMLPEAWTEQDTARGLLGIWSLLLLPAVGALAGAILRVESRTGR